jgi:NTE family protein
VPQFVEVTGTKPMLASEIQRDLSIFVGKTIDPVKFDKELTYLLGNGRFASVGYQMIEKGDQQGLQIIVKEKVFSPPEVRPLLVIDGAEYDQIQFLIGARITFFDIGTFGSEWRNDVTLGSEHALRSEFYFPMGKTRRWFVAPQAFALNAQQNFFHQNTLVAEYRNKEGGGAFDFGFVPKRSSEVRIGYRGAYQRLYPAIGGLPYGTLEGRVGTTSLRYALDLRNDPIIPTAGGDTAFRASWYDANPGAASGFALAQTEMTKFIPLKKTFSIFGTATGGTTFTYHKTGFPPFALGGGPNLYAYGKNEYLTNQYFLFRVGYLHPLWALPPLVGKKVYVIGAAEGGKLYDLSPGTSTLPGDVTAGLVMNTIFGPIEVGGAAGATGHYKFFYRLGRVF